MSVITGRLFSGSQAACKAFLRGNSNNYIYILRRPDGRPFYVGQGAGPRVFFHENEARHANNWKTNDHKLNVIRSIWQSEKALTYEIDFISDDQNAINDRETELIRTFGRLHDGGCLTNRAPGARSLQEASPFSKAKHAETLSGSPETDPERTTLNRFVLAIAPMRSSVLKPLRRSIVPKATQKNRENFPQSLRQAAALAASAAASGVMLSDACTLPRRVEVDGVKGFVENGVSCDILVSGMATVAFASDPLDETFQLSAQQAKSVCNLIGFRKCIDLGLLHDQP
ncbi:GIY-YIG nuclease family protein [Shinella sp.]|uniref:GIY-YIG nuclease family protein n=1 Tax=Shinella sp. TaxID=1870904 RepID=UPI0028A7D4FE|nr:GIY-YIG nuclease family protein [Shinella sp.]